MSLLLLTFCCVILLISLAAFVFIALVAVELIRYFRAPRRLPVEQKYRK